MGEEELDNILELPPPFDPDREERKSQTIEYLTWLLIEAQEDRIEMIAGVYRRPDRSTGMFYTADTDKVKTGGDLVYLGMRRIGLVDRDELNTLHDGYSEEEI